MSSPYVPALVIVGSVKQHIRVLGREQTGTLLSEQRLNSNQTMRHVERIDRLADEETVEMLVGRRSDRFAD